MNTDGVIQFSNLNFADSALIECEQKNEFGHADVIAKHRGHCRWIASKDKATWINSCGGSGHNFVLVKVKRIDFALKIVLCA